MASPTFEEVGLLKIFRERVGDILKTDEQRHDAFLIRWLRARELDLDKAEKMLRNSVEWRAKNGIDQLLARKPDPFFSYENYPWALQWTDKLGQPVLYLPLGKWDFRKIVSEKKTVEFQLFLAYMYERIQEEMRIKNCSRASEPTLFPITQFTMLADYTDLAYSQLLNPRAVQSMVQLASILEAHYPETMYRSILCNCPGFFSVIFTLIKSVCAPRTVDKVVVGGSEQSKWEPVVEEHLDARETAKFIQFYKQFNNNNNNN